MKLKSEFVTHESGEEQIMVGTGTSGFSGLVRSNHTAAFIINCLKQETSEAEIAAEMAAVYEAPQAVIEKGVAEVLKKLRSIGALDE